MKREYFVLIPLAFIWLVSICGVSYMIASEGYLPDVDTIMYNINETIMVDYDAPAQEDYEGVIDTVAWDWVQFEAE